MRHLPFRADAFVTLSFVRVALTAAMILVLAPTKAGAPPGPVPGGETEKLKPVVDPGPVVVRRDLLASTGSDPRDLDERRFVRAVRDLVEDRFDVDALAPDAPVTVWTVDDDVVAFEVTPPATEWYPTPRALFASRVPVGESGSERWVFDDGTTLDGPVLSRPVRYFAVSSKIGLREHPIKKKVKFHAGTDYAAPIGTPVRAIADGVVKKAAKSWTAGNFIVLHHDDGTETKYMHLNKRAPQIVDGFRVRQGEIIGEVGKTGRVTGPHLHFEVRDPSRRPLDSAAAVWPAASRIDDARALRTLHLRRQLLKTFLVDARRALLDPLLAVRPGVERPLPPPEQRGALLPPIAAARTASARARLLHDRAGERAARKKKRPSVSPVRVVFDDVELHGLASLAHDPLLVRAASLAADFPDDPRFA